ncbi:hydrogenase maturation protease [Actinotalea sp. AC32]|nr:hydrogenase maturation protease [Actinotalea sp. AC32]
MSAFVVGLGSPDRGDDAVGPAVARGVAALRLPDVRVLTHEDPTDLVELWTGAELAVVVDGVRSGAPAGTLHVVDAGVGTRGLAHPWAATGHGGTHAFGLATAVELARALDRLPPRLVVVGVEVAVLDHGAPLSGAVAHAVGPAVAAVAELVAPVGSASPEVPRVPR